MNIFAVDHCPLTAASQLCDKHVVKMVLETAQLFATLFWRSGREAPYKMTHKNHPCSLWLTESRQNAEWAMLHGLGLADEYMARYGKRHKSQGVLEVLAAQLDTLGLPDRELTPFALAMPDQYKVECPVESYRNYYRHDKVKIATWKRNRPDWI